MSTFLPLLLVLSILNVQVIGFDDFCYDGMCFDNPARDIALGMGGTVCPVSFDAVDGLPINGPVLALGVDYATDRAYTNGGAFGRVSGAVQGPDAGEYVCGHLYARALDVSPCSAFVHLPLEPTDGDLELVQAALRAVRRCGYEERAQASRQVGPSLSSLHSWPRIAGQGIPPRETTRTLVALRHH